MPRPCKQRRICAIPDCQRFGPKGDAVQRLNITMTLDEFESIRLIDLEGMTQEQCAAQMKVSRTTAQAIYNNARIKLADCLVNEKELHIGGGDFVLCQEETAKCSCGHSCKRHCNRDCITQIAQNSNKEEN